MQNANLENATHVFFTDGGYDDFTWAEVPMNKRSQESSDIFRGMSMTFARIWKDEFDAKVREDRLFSELTNRGMDAPEFD